MLITGSVAIALLGACAGGSSGSSTAGAKTQIVFSYLWAGTEAKILEQSIKQFNDSQNKITVKGVSSPDTVKQLAAMTGTHGSFDISDNFGANVASLASKGALAPLDSYISGDQFGLSDFSPAAMQQMRFQGKTYSMPLATYSQMLLYNKKLFQAAGIAKPPLTMEEWASDLAKLTKTGADGSITQLGYHINDPWTSLTTLGYAFGGDWFDGSGKPTPQAQGNVAALNFYVDNVTGKYGKDKVSKFASGYGEAASAQNPFYVGKVATVIDGPWQVAFIHQFAPGLDWGVAPIPYPAAHPELAGTTEVGVSTLFIPANSQHKKEAGEFMKFLLSPGPMLNFNVGTSNGTPRLSLLDSPKYATEPLVQPWLQALKSPNAKSFLSVAWGQQYIDDLTHSFDDIAQLRTTPAEGLKAVSAKSAAYAK